MTRRRGRAPTARLRLLVASGSGTQKTWASATGATFPWGVPPRSNIIFENETASILSNHAAAPIGNVIFFFSYGDFCTSARRQSPLRGTRATCVERRGLRRHVDHATANKVQLGTTGLELRPVTLDRPPSTLSCPARRRAEFPGDRLLYNVYSDGSNPNIPASSPRRSTSISEDGFMCKPRRPWDIDPNTGLTYKGGDRDGDREQGVLPAAEPAGRGRPGRHGHPNRCEPGLQHDGEAFRHPAERFGLTLGNGGSLGAEQNARERLR